MPVINLSNLSQPQTLTNDTNNRPLSFLEWQNRNVGISFSDAQVQYRNYIANFYEKKETAIIQESNKIREDYINLIKRLQIIFEDDDEFTRYKNINLDSPTELTLAIPAYAKKLKEIALFYVRKRSELKRKKLEYNLVGSDDGIRRILEYKLLSQFTKGGMTNFVQDNPLISQSPEFSAVVPDFSVEIEELYNTTDHFELQTQLNPFECVFNNVCNQLANIELSGKIDPLYGKYFCETTDDSVNQYLQKAYDKYLGVDVGYIQGGYYTPDYRNITVNLEDGNNYFYWFSGSTVFDIPEGQFKSLNINDIDWAGATGTDSISSSDIIYTHVGNILSDAAWLQKTDYIPTTGTLKATLTNGKIFKYPFPDYGASAIGGSWSGPGIDDTVQKDKTFFPSEEEFSSTQKNITNKYWNGFTSISTVNSTHIQSTNLKNILYASKNYNNADKVINYGQVTSRYGINSSPNIAWLYDFSQTEIPVIPGETQIYYPLQTFTEVSDINFSYEDGQDIALSSIDVPYAFAGAVAGNTIEESDKIFKLATVCGPRNECAWLRATPIKYFNSKGANCTCNDTEQVYSTEWSFISGGTQPGLSFRCEPNNFVRFTWTGETTNINNVKSFGGFLHDASCPYIQENHNISLASEDFLQNQDRTIAEKWKKCTCQAIQYSPFGHKEDNLLSLKITPDFIVKDTGFPNTFNKKNWRGTDNRPYNSSKDSARFIPTSLLEKDIGWSDGAWQDQTGGIFTLEKGQSYIYSRSNSNNCQFESPFFILNHGYNSSLIPNDECIKTTTIPQWIKAVEDLSGNWIDAGVITDMNFSYGDFLVYDHRAEVAYTKEKLLYNGMEIDAVSGSHIILNKTDSNISFLQNTYTVPSVNFIMKIPLVSGGHYWATGETFKTVSDYLQITQPIPSNLRFNNLDLIEFNRGKCDNSCVVWEENLNFSTYNPIRQWNKIYVDNCVNSDILNFLNKKITDCVLPQETCVTDCIKETSCDCGSFCYTTKTGITASNIKSNMVLNVELSGIPMYVNYYAQNGFALSFSAHDITNGENGLYVPVISGDFVESSSPWKNIINQNNSTFLTDQINDGLKTKFDLGVYTPRNTIPGRYETFNSSYTVSGNTVDIIKFRKDNYFDNPFQKSRNDSSYITLKSLGRDDGVIDISRVQSFYPYETEQFKKGIFTGLTSPMTTFTPWKVTDGSWNGGNEYRNFRNQLNVNCSNGWFSNQHALSGDVWNWDTDIFGNEYFAVVNEEVNFLSTPSQYANVFIKFQNGNILPLSQALSAIVEKYKNL